MHCSGADERCHLLARHGRGQIALDRQGGPGELPVADDPPELILGREHPGGGPAGGHLARLPARDVAGGALREITLQHQRGCPPPSAPGVPTAFTHPRRCGSGPRSLWYWWCLRVRAKDSISGAGVIQAASSMCRPGAEHQYTSVRLIGVVGKRVYGHVHDHAGNLSRWPCWWCSPRQIPGSKERFRTGCGRVTTVPAVVSATIAWTGCAGGTPRVADPCTHAHHGVAGVRVRRDASLAWVTAGG